MLILAFLPMSLLDSNSKSCWIEIYTIRHFHNFNLRWNSGFTNSKSKLEFKEFIVCTGNFWQGVDTYGTPDFEKRPIQRNSRRHEDFKSGFNFCPFWFSNNCINFYPIFISVCISFESYIYEEKCCISHFEIRVYFPGNIK